MPWKFRKKKKIKKMENYYYYREFLSINIFLSKDTGAKILVELKEEEFQSTFYMYENIFQY